MYINDWIQLCPHLESQNKLCSCQALWTLQIHQARKQLQAACAQSALPLCHVVSRNHGRELLLQIKIERGLNAHVQKPPPSHFNIPTSWSSFHVVIVYNDQWKCCFWVGQLQNSGKTSKLHETSLKHDLGVMRLQVKAALALCLVCTVPWAA